MDSITLSPIDLHVHFRQGPLLSTVCKFHDIFEYGLAMPNTVPAILNVNGVTQYRQAIMACCRKLQPLMTIQLMPDTTYDTLSGCVGKIVGCKLYPRDVTTNSEHGWSQDSLLSGRLIDLCTAMSELGLVLLVHAEMPGSFCMDRERDFLWIIEKIRGYCPKLRIVIEHISCAESVEYVKSCSSGVSATITMHHMMITLDDVIGGRLDHHNFCKPVAKRSFDRTALINAATSGDPRFMFGSDSAPHYFDSKIGGCAGCWTGPWLLSGLAEIFDSAGRLGSLSKFVSSNGRSFYGLPAPVLPPIRLVREPYILFDEYNGVVPFGAGRTIQWRVQ